jgi:hypothetical protein
MYESSARPGTPSAFAAGLDTLLRTDGAKSAGLTLSRHCYVKEIPPFSSWHDFIIELLQSIRLANPGLEWSHCHHLSHPENGNQCAQTECNPQNVLN